MSTVYSDKEYHVQLTKGDVGKGFRFEVLFDQLANQMTCVLAINYACHFSFVYRVF